MFFCGNVTCIFNDRFGDVAICSSRGMFCACNELGGGD